MAKGKKKYGAVIAVLLVILLLLLGGLGYKVYTAARNDINGVKQAKTAYTLVIEKADFEIEVTFIPCISGISWS